MKRRGSISLYNSSKYRKLNKFFLKIFSKNFTARSTEIMTTFLM